MPYTLYCAIIGHNTTFPVHTDETQTVGELKKSIKEEKKHTLASYEADQFTLYKANIYISGEEAYTQVMQDIHQGLIKVGEEMVPMFTLSRYFKEPDVREETTHILVRLPPTTPLKTTFGVLKHTPVKAKQETSRIIEEFLNDHRVQMRELVKQACCGESPFSFWKPESPTDTKLAEHLSELAIPTLASGRPSLLLHDLGEEKDTLDRDRTRRIPEIFSKGHKLLINTSGSGKTRLLLEGLCRHWGFYFVAKPDTTGIGSGDLWQVMRMLDEAADYKRAKTMMGADQGSNATILEPSEGCSAASLHISELVDRRLAQLLLARLLLLDLLVQEAQQLGGLQTKEHRRLWVLLQAHPSIFGEDPTFDIFSDLTELLQGASTNELNHRIGEMCTALNSLLGDRITPRQPLFFCVLDEVQITVSSLSGRVGEFISSDQPKKRPILRQIWLSWSKQPQMALVLSGTGIDFGALKETLASTACKEHEYKTVHDIGAFDKEELQAQYIRRYIPVPSGDPRWVDFLTRAWTWFRGRYRFTATLIFLLLEGGYECPHHTIDKYVQVFTGFEPTDGKHWTDNVSKRQLKIDLIRDRVTKLSLDKLDSQKATMLFHILYEQLLFGEYRLKAFAGADRALFVEYGFARHKAAIDEPLIDEPLAILAALHWVEEKFSVFDTLRNDIDKHAPRRNGFEAYLVFYLREVFEKAPALHSVFTFREDFAHLPWMHDEFELVTVFKPKDSAIPQTSGSPRVSIVTPTSGPSSNLGFSAKSDREVLDWISTNRGKNTFCLPPESFGPDILFFVKSKISENLLLVMIQAKCCKSVDRETLLHGVRTVTPSWLWKSKDKKHASPDTAPFLMKALELPDDTKDVLAGIQSDLKAEGAEYPVLRVFASWPGETNLERTADSTDDPDRHPIASLNNAKFNENSERFDKNFFTGRAEREIVVASKKRSREEKEFESSDVWK